MKLYGEGVIPVDQFPGTRAKLINSERCHYLLENLRPTNAAGLLSMFLAEIPKEEENQEGKLWRHVTTQAQIDEALGDLKDARISFGHFTLYTLEDPEKYGEYEDLDKKHLLSALLRNAAIELPSAYKAVHLVIPFAVPPEHVKKHGPIGAILVNVNGWYPNSSISVARCMRYIAKSMNVPVIGLHIRFADGEKNVRKLKSPFRHLFLADRDQEFDSTSGERKKRKPFFRCFEVSGECCPFLSAGDVKKAINGIANYYEAYETFHLAKYIHEVTDYKPRDFDSDFFWETDKIASDDDFEEEEKEEEEGDDY